MDPRFLLEQGTGIYTGNELIVKGALESQVGIITGYPGSPLAELFETLENNKDLFNEHGIVAQIANNEALAAARLNGSQMEGIRALAVMKSVGLHVAADGLALGNMVGASPSGGVLVAVGDDTWSEGTQVPADSRFLSQHLYMPVLEPATFQEIKDWIGKGFELSRRSRLYLTYLVTSNQADGGGSVTVYHNRFAALNRKQRIALDTSAICSDDRVIIPPATAHKEREVVHQRYPHLWQLAREAGINQILYPPSAAPKPLGFITSGLAYSYLEHALHILGLTGHFPILKLGITYPVDPHMIARFADCAQTFCVVEEKRPFIEPQIAAELARQQDLGPALWGKHFPGNAPGFPDVQGLHPSLIVQALSRLFAALDAELPIDREKLQAELDALAPVPSTTTVPPRAPSFCPGCPHRDSASVLKKATADLAAPPDGQAPVDLVFHGDIGCYSMLKYAPFSELMHNLSGMGLGGGTGAGIDPFIDNKQVVFMGDSTFFHTGMIAISDSIKNGQDITYIILDNKTTAMTGHQPTPGVAVDILGKPTFAQDIEKVVAGLAGDSSTFIARMDPSQRQDYDALVRKTLLRDGVKIIIADKECGITYHRRERARQSAIAKEQGFLPVEKHINISEDVCEYCLECTQATGCSGLTVAPDTEYGPKIAIDPSSCVADGACTRVEVGDGDKTCPSFEEVTVQRKAPPTVSTPPIDVGQLPTPARRPLNDIWYTYIAGVGGMGVNVVASVLAQAGVRQGYEVRLTNKKGLAIRNGSVYSHLSYSPKGTPVSPLIPCGKADLLLGLDVLEAARGLEPQGRYRIAHPERTAAIVNTAKTPTIDTLIGQEDFSAEAQADLIHQHTRPDAYFGADLFRICEHYLGNKLYANIMMLGVAFQRGLLSLELDTLLWAIGRAVRRDLEINLKAFNMGRYLALDPNHFPLEEKPLSYAELVADKTALLAQTRGKRVAEAYRQRIRETPIATARRHFALRVYDLIQYENLDYADRYIHQVLAVQAKDGPEFDFTATRTAIYQLAKVLAIKDEVYVAHLLTCKEKYRRDRRRYNIDPSRGDRIRYRHLNRPHLRLFGRDFRPDIKLGDRPLKLIARMKFLRRLCSSWWHREERDFAAWYESLISDFSPRSADEYHTWVQVLSLPEEVRGYRGVRQPKMEAAKKRAAELLAGHEAAPDPALLQISVPTVS